MNTYTIKRELKTYIERKYCSRCEVELLDSVPVMRMLDLKFRHLHVCPKCKAEHIDEICYPREVTEECP